MNKLSVYSIVFSIFVVVSSSLEIRSYFLNKHADLLRKPFSIASGRECLHTTRTDIKITPEITICYRQKPYMIRGKSGVFTFGISTIRNVTTEGGIRLITEKIFGNLHLPS